MNKNIIKYIALCILPVWMTACSNETALDNSQSGDFSLVIKTVGSSTRTAVDPGTNDENALKDVKVWIFSTSASDTDKPLLYQDITEDVVSSQTVIFPEKELEAKYVNPNAEYLIYSVANLPSKVRLDENSTLGALKSCAYMIAYDDENSNSLGRPETPFVMSGVLTHNFGKSRIAILTLVRVAVKLNISWTDNSGLALSTYIVTVANDLSNGGIFSSLLQSNQLPFTADEVYQKRGDANNMAVYYINEHVNAANPVSITIDAKSAVDGKKYSWSCPLKINGSSDLIRNTLFNVNVGINAFTPNVTVNAIPWDSTINDDDQTLLPD